MAGVVVRARPVGKHHLPANDSLTMALCGAAPSSIGAFPYRGERDAFETVCPERICKRCRAAEKAVA